MASQIITKNSRETQKVAGLLARRLGFECATRVAYSKGAVVLALRGDLGAGKTTFIQGFARGLGIKEKILSPTFVILKRFRIPRSHLAIKPLSHSATKSLNHSITQSLKYFYHIDCYRIDGPKEILDLGFNEIINNPENIVVIEWAERIKRILPKSAIWMDFEWLDRNKRKITIK